MALQLSALRFALVLQIALPPQGQRVENDMEKRITLTRSDIMKLRTLIRNEQAFSIVESAVLDDLQDEIDRAYIVDQHDLPEDTVTLDSRVLIRDLKTGECSVYTLVCRARADLSRGELSILAPLGMALIGYRAGDEVEWSTPGGVRHLLIEAVKQADDLPEGPPPPPRERLAA
jgi:regulator of nucleoside diphosphate kinase